MVTLINQISPSFEYYQLSSLGYSPLVIDLGKQGGIIQESLRTRKFFISGKLQKLNFLSFFINLENYIFRTFFQNAYMH